MSKTAHLGLSVALLVCLPLSSAEAAMNKCTDGKQITYTTEPCEKTGLTSAGPIKEAVTVMTFVPGTKNDTSEKQATNRDAANDNPRNAVPGNDDSGADVSREATIKPVSPLVDRMLH